MNQISENPILVKISTPEKAKNRKSFFSQKSEFKNENYHKIKNLNCPKIHLYGIFVKYQNYSRSKNEIFV